MGYVEDMNAAFVEQQESQTVQEFRAKVQNLKNVADETKTALDEIIAGGTFGTVAQSIKDEGGDVRQLVNSLVTDLAAHSDFIDWTQPE